MIVHVDEKGRKGFCSGFLIFLIASKQAQPFLNRGPWKLAYGHLEVHQILGANSNQTLYIKSK